MAFSQSQKKWLSKIIVEPDTFIKAEQANFQHYVGQYEIDGNSVMHYAVMSGHKELIFSLISHGASFFDKSHNNDSPFDWVCKNANDPKIYQLAMLCLKIEPEKFLAKVKESHVNLLLTAAYHHSNENFNNLLDNLPWRNYNPSQPLLNSIMKSDDTGSLEILSQKWHLDWPELRLKTSDDITTNVNTLAAFNKAPKCLDYFFKKNVCVTGLPTNKNLNEKIYETYSPAVIAAKNGDVNCLKILQDKDPKSMWRPQSKNEQFPLAAAAESSKAYHWMIQQPDIFVQHIEATINSIRGIKQLPISAALNSNSSLLDQKDMVLNALDMYEKNFSPLNADFNYISEIEATSFYEQYSQWCHHDLLPEWIEIGQRMKKLGMNKPRNSSVTSRSLAFKTDYAHHLIQAGLDFDTNCKGENILATFARDTNPNPWNKENPEGENVFIANMHILKNHIGEFKVKNQQELNYLQIISDINASEQSWFYDILSEQEIKNMNQSFDAAQAYPGLLGKADWPAHKLLSWSSKDTEKIRTTLKRLINHKMDIESKGETQLTLLHIAACKGFDETCTMLLQEFKANITPTGEGSFWHTCTEEKCVKILVEHGLNLADHDFLTEIMDKKNSTSPYLFNQNKESLNLYLKAGGDVNLILKNGNNILIEAIVQQRWAIAELLIDQRPDLAKFSNNQKKLAIDYIIPKATSKIPQYWEEEIQKNTNPSTNFDNLSTLSRTFYKLYAISEIDHPSRLKSSARYLLENKYRTWWDNNSYLRAKATEFKLHYQISQEKPDLTITKKNRI